jgi:hypothetical protein
MKIEENKERNWGLKKGVIDFVAVVQRVCVCVVLC